jgi:hypothetical protein
LENLLKRLNRTSVLFLLIVFLAAALTPNVHASVTYAMKGAYNENGSFNPVGINVTMTRQSEAPSTFFLNGTYLANATVKVIVFNFDLGYNESRTFYTVNGAAETIYVLLPQEPYYTYFFEVIDYVGLSWGYLESMLNVNGTDTVVERWSLNVMNEMPFTLSWGKAYSMRLVCNKGTYTYGSYVAGATTSFTLAVTADMFPIAPTDINGLSVRATRMNITWIQCYYMDIYSDTTWVNFDIIEYGETTPIYSYNSSSQMITLNWMEAASDTDYYVLITISHSLLGFKTWSFPCPAPVASTNPFGALSYLGTFPFAADQLPAIVILVCFGLCFSWYSIPVGMIVEVIVAAILVWLGWLAIGWTWLTLSGTMVMIIAIAEAKQREISTP